MDAKIIESLDRIEKKQSDREIEFKAQLEAVNKDFEKKVNEYKAMLETEKTANETKARELSDELAKSGATVAEMRKEVLEMKAKQGRFRDGSNIEKKAQDFIAEAFLENFEKIKKISKQNPLELELKASGVMTAAANLTGNVVATYDLAPAVRGRRKVNIRDLVQIIPSATGLWKFYRENIPAPQSDGSFGYAYAGSVKNEVAYGLTEVNVVADYIAGFVRFAKQMAQDLPFLQTFIANELVEDYKRMESGIFLPLIIAAAAGSTTLPGGVTVLAEKYIYWIANLKANDYEPNAIVTTATNWGIILTTKPLDYSVPGGVQITPDGMVMFCGLPLIPQNNMPANTTLIGDWTKAAIIQTEGLSVQFAEFDSDNFQKNLITARCEARVGLAILRPDAFIDGAN